MMRARYVHTSGCCAYAGDALGTESWVKVYVTDDTASSLQRSDRLTQYHGRIAERIA